MKKTLIKKVLKSTGCIVLIAAVALFTFGCNNTQQPPQTPAPAYDTQAAQPLGEGEIQFTFTVTDPDGKETAYNISTDKTVVGEALQELGLIDGDEGPYGLYVKTVNGITVDYDTHGMYWAFYTNGEMTPTGVDTTEIVPGTVYSFRAEK